MGPPREHGGMLLAPRRRTRPGTSALQWGRRVNTAECSASIPVSSPWRSLQWGRRVNTAECAEPVTVITSPTALQWGRRVNTAEWNSPVNQITRVDGTLQWGRRVNTAEWETPRPIRFGGDLASMGPPREHGGM